MLAIPTRPYFRALYCKRYTRWINGLGTRLASYQQSKTRTRPILHSALATKMGQAPTESYTERMKHTQATRHDSKGLPSDKRENTQL